MKKKKITLYIFIIIQEGFSLLKKLRLTRMADCPPPECDVDCPEPDVDCPDPDADCPPPECDDDCCFKCNYWETGKCTCKKQQKRSIKKEQVVKCCAFHEGNYECFKPPAKGSKYCKKHKEK
jgi:hypothetical protein